MKGCGDDNPTFSKYSPDFSLPEVQEGLLKNQYNLQNPNDKIKFLKEIGDLINVNSKSSIIRNSIT